MFVLRLPVERRTAWPSDWRRHKISLSEESGGEGLNNPVNQHFCEPKMMTFVPRGEIFNVTSSSDGLDVSSQPQLR